MGHWIYKKMFSNVGRYSLLLLKCCHHRPNDRSEKLCMLTMFIKNITVLNFKCRPFSIVFLRIFQGAEQFGDLSGILSAALFIRYELRINIMTLRCSFKMIRFKR